MILSMGGITARQAYTLKNLEKIVEEKREQHNKALREYRIASENYENAFIKMNGGKNVSQNNI